jgi:hypothetical protein
MVDGVSNYMESLKFSLDYSSKHSEKLRTKDPEHEGKAPVNQFEIADSLDFSMDYSRTMQVLEGESERSLKESMSFEFNLSVDFSGKLRGSFEGPGAPANARGAEESEEVEKEDDDPWSPKNTAGRIVDFVKQAFEMINSRQPGLLDTEAGLDQFRTSQTDAVKLGFKQARNILGNLTQDKDDRVASTYDYVMEGLDKFFDGDEDEEVVEEAPPQEPTRPGQGNFYSSQSFSLSFEVEIEASGNFNQDDLDAFVKDSFGQVNDIFQKFIGGGEGDEEGGGFNPMELFNLDQLRPDRTQSLLEE